MGKVIRLAAFRKLKLSQDSTAKKNASAKGGIVINWATARPARGEERGAIAIIRPEGGP